MPKLETRQVIKKFSSVTAVDSVSLRVEEGSAAFILGPSGCGKTTLLRLIAGLEQPDGGDVVIDGTVVTDLRPDRRKLGFVFQQYALWPHLTVEEHIRYGLEVRKLPAAEIRARVETLSEFLALTSLSKRKPHELSGGQQQRVALARALAPEPGILLLDEPFANLDARLRDELRRELKRLQQSFGITIVFVTHDRSEALSLADQIVLMNSGKVIASGPPAELYRNPPDIFSAAFLGEVVDLGDGTFARPESFRSIPPSEPHSTIMGTVEDVQFLGADYHVRLRRREAPTILVRSSGEHVLRTDQEMVLYLPNRARMNFPA